METVTEAGHRDRTRQRFHARIKRAGHDKVEENDEGYECHYSNHTKLTNHVPTQFPTGTGATGTTVHSPVVTVCNMGCVYIHNMPRDSPSRLRRKPCSRTTRGMRRFTHPVTAPPNLSAGTKVRSHNRMCITQWESMGTEV